MTRLPIVLLCLTACSSEAVTRPPEAAPAPKALTSVTIEKPSPNFAGLGAGTHVLLRAHAYASDGTEILSGVTFIWISSAPDIISVDSEGVLTGKQSGDVTITVVATSSVGWAETSVKLFGVVLV